jgi:hypothetical protein
VMIDARYDLPDSSRDLEALTRLKDCADSN